MIASAVSRTLALLACVAVLAACTTPRAPADLSNPLEPLSAVPARPPGPEDFAAARLAAAALASNRAEMEIALDALERVDAVQRRTPADDDTDLLPIARDVVNSTLDDPDDYRLASKELLRNGDEDRALRARLEAYVDDDPLEIAQARILDSYQTVFARTFNAIAEPLGKSAITGVAIAPLTIASAVAHWLATMYSRDPISLHGRQALVQQQRFLREHPDSPIADEIRDDMEGPQQRLARTYRNKYVEGAEAALAAGRPRLALVYANRALYHVPDDARAAELKTEAEEAILDQQALFWASTRGTLEPLPDLDPRRRDAARDLARAMLLPGVDATAPAEALIAVDPSGPLVDEADFAIATAEFERGWESLSFDRLTTLGDDDPSISNMARHAEALVADPWVNVYGEFERKRTQQNSKLAGWKLLGPWSERPRYDRLPMPIAYLIDAPAVAQALVTSPIRLVMSLMKPDKDFRKPTSVVAYRYLDRYPDGEHQPELVRWLYDYEHEMENYNAALRLADFIPEFDPDERLVLVEQAATQQLNNANKAPRRDMRGTVLRTVARDYPDTEAGHFAGEQARDEIENATPQKIRMTREFLVENPQVAGSEGLGIRAELRDGDPSNGELHPWGVTFLGRREIEMAFLAESGDEDDEPVTVKRTISEQRLARTVALLEETVHHNALVDEDDTVATDARRDYYFERARLGLTDVPDMRATAESTYVYRGMRERYGMVRAREGILPFDLVVQGSLADFSIGAFPRFREPKETDDAFLYR